jgi:addiction module RelE/StbE family toxin
MQLVRDDKYNKIELKFFKKHPNLIDKYAETLKKLVIDPYEPSLKTHLLKGKFKGLSACSINYEYRIIMKIKIVNEQIYLIDVGTHEIYK